MIVPMKKYDIVLYHREKEEFLNRLQDLGLVDITTTGWEPDERQRELMLLIERHKTAIEKLKEVKPEEGESPAEPYPDGREAFERYTEAASNIESINGRLAQIEKECDDLYIWGDFDPERIKKLEEAGIKLYYFSAFTKEFEAHLPAWQERYDIARIAEDRGSTYFVVIAGLNENIEIEAQAHKPLTSNIRQHEKEISKLVTEKKTWYEILKRAASSSDLIRATMDDLKEQLHFSQVADSGTDEAEGTLILMEGWATQETEANVDAMLAEYPGVFYIKSDPTPEDTTPVLLKNNRFNRLFEFIGNFYSLPKYGSMDLTWAFGPFYLLFFGLCLGDAGYGLILLIGGLILGRKVPKIKGVANLVMLCGFATFVCGAFMGSFFGIQFAGEGAPLEGLKQYILSPDNLFYLALGIGVVQILFGMTLKVVLITKQFSFKYALSTLGWMLVLVASIVYFVFPMIWDWANAYTQTMYLATLGVGAFMMLFLNAPGKNPLSNLGAGLWNTFNDVTGILSDVLSYIRLFAIGLSGGTLALVFNQLAVGLSPDIPVVKQLVIIIILFIGHGINLFMSTLSSFVHPMRLTFVEFFKNAGFEMTSREFTPFKRNKEN